MTEDLRAFQRRTRRPARELDLRPPLPCTVVEIDIRGAIASDSVIDRTTDIDHTLVEADTGAIAHRAHG